MQSYPQNLSYTKYLESVLDIADEYHEIPDLLMRHATLEATNKVGGGVYSTSAASS